MTVGQLKALLDQVEDDDHEVIVVIEGGVVRDLELTVGVLATTPTENWALVVSQDPANPIVSECPADSSGHPWTTTGDCAYCGQPHPRKAEFPS